MKTTHPCDNHRHLADQSDAAWRDYIAAWRLADMQLAEAVEQLQYQAETIPGRDGLWLVQAIAAQVATYRAQLAPAWDRYMSLAHRHVACHGIR